MIVLDAQAVTSGSGSRRPGGRTHLAAAELVRRSATPDRTIARIAGRVIHSGVRVRKQRDRRRGTKGRHKPAGTKMGAAESAAPIYLISLLRNRRRSRPR